MEKIRINGLWITELEIAVPMINKALANDKLTEKAFTAEIFWNILEYRGDLKKGTTKSKAGRKLPEIIKLCVKEKYSI